MIVNLFTKTDEGQWVLSEEWPTAERAPCKDELVLTGSNKEMRVIEVRQAVNEVDIYLAATYADPLGRLG